MPKEIWDAAVVVASLSSFFTLGECHAREYLTTLGDADATLLLRCLRRLGWWFPDDQQSAQERLVWWLFRDDVTRLDFSDGTERRRIETPEERLRETNEEVRSIARMVTIQADSCLAVAAYVRALLDKTGRNNPPLYGRWRRGWPSEFSLEDSTDGMRDVTNDPAWLESFRFDEFCFRFDGELLDTALSAAATRLNLPSGRLKLREATGHTLNDELYARRDLVSWLESWRDGVMRAAWERQELPRGWEPSGETWPASPIENVENLREWLSGWLESIHRARSSSWGSPELCLDDVQRELRNSRRAMRAWDVSLPPQFDDDPASIIEAEKQLELLIDLLGTTEQFDDVPTEQQLNLARNLALEANHKAHSLPAWFRYQETSAAGWNAEPHRIIDTLAKLAADLDAALTDVVTGWLHRWNCGEERTLEIGGRSFHTAHEAAFECVSRALTAFKNAEQRGPGSKVELPPTMLTPDRFVAWEWDHEQLNKQIEREWGRAIRRLPDAASTETTPPVILPSQAVQEVASPAVQKEVAPPRVLKEPKPEAIAAYRLSMLGWNQQPIADQLTKEFKRPFQQWKVSRLLADARNWLEAGNVFPPLLEAKPATTVDPAQIDKGARQDHQTPRQRHRQSSDE
jgi:hypothetical protein